MSKVLASSGGGVARPEAWLDLDSGGKNTCDHPKSSKMVNTIKAGTRKLGILDFLRELIEAHKLDFGRMGLT